MTDENKSTTKEKKLTYKGAAKKAIETLEKMAKGYEVVEKQEFKLPSGKKRVKTVRKHVKPDKMAAKMLVESAGERDEEGKIAGYHLPPYLEITPEDEILLRTSQLCKMFDISDRTLTNWSRTGAKNVRTGWWNLREMIEWRLKTAGISAGGGESKEARKLEADIKLKQNKAKVEELRLERMLNKMVPISMVEEAMCNNNALAAAAMRNIGEVVFTNLNAKYPEIMHDVRRIINDEINRACEQLSTNGVVDTGTREEMETST